MTAAVWWNAYWSRIDNSKTIRWTLIECLSIALVISYVAYLRTPVFGFLSPLLPENLTNWLVRADTSPLFALLIIVTANEAGWVSRALASLPLVFLGEISSSIYMLHQIIIRLLARYGLISVTPKPWYFFAAAVLIIGSAFMLMIADSPAKPRVQFTLQTNGTLLHRHDHAKMRAAGMTDLQVSVDSAEPETQKILRTSLSSVRRPLRENGTESNAEPRSCDAARAICWGFPNQLSSDSWAV